MEDLVVQNPLAAPADSRRMALAVVGYYFFSLAGLSISLPYLPLYWKSVGYHGASLGVLLTALGLGPLLAQGPLGYLSDRSGQRRIIVAWSMALGGLMMVFYPAIGSFPALLIVTLVTSALFRSSDALVQAIVGDWAAGAKMASTFGRLRVAGSVGWVLSLLASTRVAPMTDLRPFEAAPYTTPMFLVIGSMCFVSAASILWMRPVPPRDRLRLGPVAAVLAVARAPRVGGFLLAFVLFWTCMQSIGAFLSLHMGRMGASHPEISAAFVVSAMAETPFIFLAGRLADRYGDRRLLSIAFLTMPVRLLIYAVAPSLGCIYIAQSLHSLTYGLSLVGAVAYMSHNLPDSLRASGQGALGVVMSAGSTAAPSLGAVVAAAEGYRGAFAAMAALALVAWLLLRALPVDSSEREQALAPA